MNVLISIVIATIIVIVSSLFLLVILVMASTASQYKQYKYYKPAYQKLLKSKLKIVNAYQYGEWVKDEKEEFFIWFDGEWGNMQFYNDDSKRVHLLGGILLLFNPYNLYWYLKFRRKIKEKLSDQQKHLLTTDDKI